MILGDVGGQRTLRPYWRNYFEQTDAIAWVVDSGDRMRIQDCKEELHSLLLEDVCILISPCLILNVDMSPLEACRCISSDICEQTRHLWLYDG